MLNETFSVIFKHRAKAKSQPGIEITKSDVLGNTTADVIQQNSSDEQRNKKEEFETYGSSNVDIEVEMKKNEGSKMNQEIGDEGGLAEAGTILNPLDLAKEEEVQLPNFQQGGTLLLLHRKKVISFHFLSFTGLESPSENSLLKHIDN